MCVCVCARARVVARSRPAGVTSPYACGTGGEVSVKEETASQRWPIMWGRFYKIILSARWRFSLSCEGEFLQRQ